MNLYLLKNGIYHTEDKDLPRWVTCFDAAAFFCFWISHWLYVSQFVKVVIKAPKVFGGETENGSNKTCCVTFLFMLDIIVYTAVFACMIYRMIEAKTLSSNYA